jgi:GNAT superfamily N-acetyltransferase
VRGRGIGRALAQRALELAREKGARTAFLLTSPELTAALALYRSLGFRPVPEPPVPDCGFQRPSLVLQLDLVASPPESAP